MKNTEWIAQISEYDNAIAAVKNFIIKSKVSVDLYNVEEVIHNHPNFPSILSISDALTWWNIKNMIVRISVDDLSQIPYPAISLIKDEKYESRNKYIVITNYSKNQIEYIDPELGYITVVEEEFKVSWEGITLLAQIDQNSGEKKTSNKSSKWSWKEYALSSTGIFIILLLVLLQSENHLIWSLLFLLKVAGVFITFQLVNLSFGNETSTSKKLCSKKSHSRISTNCSKVVLESPAAKLFGRINLSEIGLLYFVFGICTLAIATLTNISTDALHLLGFISLIVLPYSFYSIYYQAVRLKTFCTLCTLTQIIIWAEVLCYLFINSSTLFDPTIALLPTAFLSICIPTVIWLGIRPLFFLKQENQKLEAENLHYEQLPQVFELELAQSLRVDKTEISGDIIIGNPQADHVIMLVTNPFCSACRDFHAEFKEVVEWLSKDIKIIVRILAEEEVNIQSEYMNLENELSSITDKEELKSFRNQYGSPKKWIANLEEKAVNIMNSNDLIRVLLRTSQDHNLFLKALDELYDINMNSIEERRLWECEFDLKPAALNYQSEDEYMTSVIQWTEDNNIHFTPAVFFDEFLITKPQQLKNKLIKYLRYLHNKTKDNYTVSKA